MSHTQSIHRLILIVPEARCAGLNAWVKAELDPTGTDWFVPSLSATGELPATHAWSSFSLTEDEGTKLLTRLSQAAGMEVPGNWLGMTREQKKDWLQANRTTVDQNIGVWIEPGENDVDDGWPDSQKVLTETGLKIIRPSLP